MKKEVFKVELSCGVRSETYNFSPEERDKIIRNLNKEIGIDLRKNALREQESIELAKRIIVGPGAH